MKDNISTLKSWLIKQKGKSQNGRKKKTKHAKFSKKASISYPLIATHAFAYQGVKNVNFSENLALFVFLEPPFEIRLFALLLTVVLR